MDGIFTTQQLNELGFNSTQINRKLGTSLHRIENGLYRNRELSVPETMSALQRHRPTLVFTGDTAYDLYRHLVPTLPLSATGPKARTTELLRMTRSRRTGHRLVDGFRVVSPLRAAAGVDERTGRLAAFLEEQYASWRGRDQFTMDLKELTPAEKALLQPALDRATIGASSRWERQVIERLGKIGLDPVPNYRLGPYHWDLGFRHGSTVLDLDSDRHHGSGVKDRTFIVDRWKTNHAVRAGWAPLRYTNYCTDHAMKWLVRELANTLEARRKDPSTRYGRDFPEPGVWNFHLWISG
ncbi:hypothetical protein [Corynebacterium guangdongense]|uniref:DUF559 domain-containing protein n=1 Tax=Corynebacterium guangdongense TaxID=1783348 RepID=A0ABU1ZU55_9CORY|nr:hypothetical protein [Corynebacterium guangdongense]MDR7328464.1 hypothetical protein [Corynebacterium guangdongense]WJZ17041.1 hypothetical protein CGUA_02205 [Corynebacterium guangdongense]